MNFAKGNLVVCLACRTATTELIKVWYEYYVEASVASSATDQAKFSVTELPCSLLGCEVCNNYLRVLT